jgi:hypothetical protein
MLGLMFLLLQGIDRWIIPIELSAELGAESDAALESDA